MATCTGIPMGGFSNPQFGGDGTNLSYNFILKQKFRWMFSIENITDGDQSSEPLPCIKASRPKIQFREMQAEGLNETIFYPGKPDWQPINISLYDRCITTENPIMSWLKQQYNPQGNLGGSGCSAWYPCCDPLSFKTCASLYLLDACGTIVEGWTFEHAYPSSIDFGELDMNDIAVVTVDFTLRYDRAWQFFPATAHNLYNTTECNVCEDPTCNFTATTSSSSSNSSGGSSSNNKPDTSNGGSQNQPSNPSQAFMSRVIEPDFAMF